MKKLLEGQVERGKVSKKDTYMQKHILDNTLSYYVIQQNGSDRLDCEPSS